MMEGIKKNGAVQKPEAKASWFGITLLNICKTRLSLGFFFFLNGSIRI